MNADVELLKQELASADLFYEWDDLLIELVASICEQYVYQQGEVVFNDHTPGDELFIIAEGEVEIRVRPMATGELGEGGYTTIAVLRRGQNFGEVALLDAGRRSAAAVVSEPNTRLIVIPREKIILMCENVPRLGYHLMRNIAADLAMKIRNTDLEIRAQLTWIPPK